MPGPVGISLAVNVLPEIAEQMKKQGTWPINILGEETEAHVSEVYEHEGYLTVTFTIPPRMASILLLLKEKVMWLDGERQVVMIRDGKKPEAVDVQHDNKDA